jgi:phospholipase C
MQIALAVVVASGILFVPRATGASTTSSTKPPPPERVTGGTTGSYIVPPGIHKIQHVIIIEQENRSFDNYFGTFPGALGIPMRQGVSTVCIPNPAKKSCTKL